jgi:YVTN family beta-propeller protein
MEPGPGGAEGSRGARHNSPLITAWRLGMVVAALVVVFGAVACSIVGLAGPPSIARIGGPGIRAIQLPGHPGHLAFAEGRLWATAHDGKWPMVLTLDPATGRILTGPVRAMVPKDCGAGELAAGAGAAWMVAHPLEDGSAPIPNGFLLRVDPGTGTTKRIVVGHRPSGIAFGYGSVWVANDGDDTVSRVDPSTDRVVATIAVGHGPGAVTTGSGRVWVTNSLGVGAVSGIDPATDEVAVTIRGIDGPSAADGWLWAVGSGRPNGAVVRIDPVSGSVSGPSFGLDIQPADLAAGDDTVWFTKWFENPSEQGGPNVAGPVGWPRVVVRLVRIDPRTGHELGQPITVASLPTHPLVAAGAVWVASLEANALLRIDFDAPFRQGN